MAKRQKIKKTAKKKPAQKKAPVTEVTLTEPERDAMTLAVSGLTAAHQKAQAAQAEFNRLDGAAQRQVKLIVEKAGAEFDGPPWQVSGDGTKLQRNVVG